MNDLGIAIRQTINGAGEPITINEGDWIRNVADVRPLLTKIRGLEDGMQILKILSFTDNGCLLTLTRIIAGRSGDNIAAWIFIPATIEISGKDVRYVMDVVEQTILSPTLDTSKLEIICQQPYPTRDYVYSKSSTGDKIAYKIYNDNTIEDILGSYRYQPYYDEYRYIFLFDSNSTLSLETSVEGTDLSEFTNEKPLLLAPLTPHALRLNWQVPLSFNDLILIDEEKKPIATKDYHIVIKVEDSILSPNQVIGIDERTAKNTSIEVICNSNQYQTVRKIVDITVKPIKIELPYYQVNKNVTIITRNGNEANLEYIIKGAKNNEGSPINGYYFNRQGKLVYDAHKPLRYRAQGFITATAIALLCLLLASFFPEKKKIQQQPAIPTIHQVKEPQPTDAKEAYPTAQPDESTFTYEQAIEYLDKNNVWKRSEMEQYATLQGLFDDMNEFKLHKLSMEWKERLVLSENFKKISEVAAKNIRKQWNPAIGNHAPHYNKPGDDAISLVNYINWLDQNQSKLVNKSQRRTSGRPLPNPVAGKRNRNID